MERNRRKVNKPPRLSVYDRGRQAAQWVFAVCLIAGMSYGAVHFRFNPFRERQAKALGAMASAVVEALRANDLAAAAEYCADGEGGAAFLQEANARIFRPGQQPPAQHGARVACIEFLAAMRKDMGQQGLPWERAQPLAFGGIQAQVLDPQKMRKAAVSVTGDLYFSAAGAVYALELTARRCDTHYVVVDFWKCESLSISPEAIEAYSSARFKNMLKKPAIEPEQPKIKHPRYVFVGLKEPQ